jgi:hypothetical protein
MAIPEWVLVTLKVVKVLDQLSVPYVIGGSLASIVYGMPRTTLDADFVVDLKTEQIDPFVAELEQEFYVEPESIKQAISRRSSFKLIHQATMFKVDIFIPKPRAFDHAQLAHRVKKTICTDPEHYAFILSAEDIILAKLEWYQMGGRVSERQWRDVLEVLKTQSEQLDFTYMSKMAASLHVEDLLETAIKASKE